MHERNAELELIKHHDHDGDHNCLVNFAEFMKRLQINDANRTASKLFAIFDTVYKRWNLICVLLVIDLVCVRLLMQEETGVIDIRAYLLCAVYLLKREQPKMVEYFELIAKVSRKQYNRVDRLDHINMSLIPIHRCMPVNMMISLRMHWRMCCCTPACRGQSRNARASSTSWGRTGRQWPLVRIFDTHCIIFITFQTRNAFIFHFLSNTSQLLGETAAKTTRHPTGQDSF